jgi:hypothetical protein
MLDDPQAQQSLNKYGGQHIVKGTTVFDLNGDEVGTVDEDHSHEGYLSVQRGMLFKHDVYIPMDVVARIERDGVHLRMGSDTLMDQNWDQPPDARSQGTSSGMLGSQTPSPITAETAAGGADQTVPPEHYQPPATGSEGGQMDSTGLAASGQANAPVSGGRNPLDTAGIGSEGERGGEGIVGSASVPNTQGIAGTSVPEEGAATSAPVENWRDNPAEEQRENRPGEDVSDTSDIPLNP